VVLLPVMPVALVAWVFHEVLLGILFVAFGAFVLLFSLGPRDLKTEVDDYIEALGRGDREAAARVAREIMEHDAGQRTGVGPDTLEEAIFVQTNNRLFGVVFWFMLLGPAGAWLFRVSDLMRRRAVFEYRGRAESSGQVPDFVEALHAIYGVLAWAPARLLSLGYALAGSFEQALGEWRRQVQNAGARFSTPTITAGERRDRSTWSDQRGRGRSRAAGRRTGSRVHAPHHARTPHLAGFHLGTGARRLGSLKVSPR
jgi:membrane protein required for beta-lactamase induction